MKLSLVPVLFVSAAVLALLGFGMCGFSKGPEAAIDGIMLIAVAAVLGTVAVGIVVVRFFRRR